jgi:MFS family permease
MYILPPLIAAWHVFGREASDQRLYALRTPVDTALLGFLAVTLCLVPFSRVPLEALKGLGWYVCNGVVIFYIVLNSRLVTERRTTLIHTLVFGAALAGLLSANVLWGHLQNAAHSDVRLGTGGVAVVLSALGIVITPLAIARFEQAQRPWRRAAYLLAAVVLAGTTLMAWRRSGLLFLALALFLYFWRERRRVALLVGLIYTGMLAALLATGAAGYRPETIVADLRADVDRQVNVLDHVQPLRMVVGVGARALPAHAQKDQNVRSAARKDRNVRAPRVPSPNNTWLTLLAEHGVLGFAFFAAFMLRGIALMWRATGRISDTSARKDLWATAVGLIGFAGLMCTADLFYRLPMLLIFWCAMGLGVGTALMYQPGPRTYYRLVHYRHKL